MCLVYARESSIDALGRARKIERDGHCRGSHDLGWYRMATLAEELEEDVAAERNTGEEECAVRKLREQTFQRKREIGCLAGMIESGQAIHLITAGAEDQQVGAPASYRRFLKHAAGVMRPHPAFE